MCFPYRIHMGSEGYIFYLHEFHPINPSTIRMFRLHHLTMVTHRFGSTQVVGQWYGDLLGMEFSYPVILWGEIFRFTIFINISKKKNYGKTTRIQGKVERGCFFLFCFASLIWRINQSINQSIIQSINQSIKRSHFWRSQMYGHWKCSTILTLSLLFKLHKLRKTWRINYKTLWRETTS